MDIELDSTDTKRLDLCLEVKITTSEIKCHQFRVRTCKTKCRTFRVQGSCYCSACQSACDSIKYFEVLKEAFEYYESLP